MSKRWTPLRNILVALAAGMVCYGINSLMRGGRMVKEFQTWQAATPIDTLIDFCKPGQFVVEFNQTCSSAHEEILSLRIPEEALQNTSITQILSGLAAKIEITPASNTNLVASADAAILWHEATLDGSVPIFSVTPFQTGTYEATITITEGAKSLEGITQRLDGRYLLCGLEAMPAVISIGMGALSTIIGAAVGLAVLQPALRDRRKREAPENQSTK